MGHYEGSRYVSDGEKQIMWERQCAEAQKYNELSAILSEINKKLDTLIGLHKWKLTVQETTREKEQRHADDEE